MEDTSRALLTVRFAPHLNRRDLFRSNRPEAPSNLLPTCERTLPLLEEVPDWAPRPQSPATACATALVDHYESWQGICW